jgi:hypothetical protein
MDPITEWQATSLLRPVGQGGEDAFIGRSHGWGQRVMHSPTSDAAVLRARTRAVDRSTT